MAWINKQNIEVTSSSIARGPYGTPTKHTINDSAAVTIMPANATTGQYFTISNTGGTALLQFGDDATAEIYNIGIPDGFNDWNIRIPPNEKVTAICPPGETTNLIIAIAPEVQI